MVRCFYRRPLGWVALVVSAAFLTYGGGAVMFWFHAVVRGEAGPAIADLHHWLLDSTLGFVALTPALAVIVPLAAWQAEGAGRRRPRARLGAFVTATAILFTLFTGPGPLLHNYVAGPGTPLADAATTFFGEAPASADHAEHAAHRRRGSPAVESLLQVLVGLPVYLACTMGALVLVRTAVGATRRRVGAAAGGEVAGVG